MLYVHYNNNNNNNIYNNKTSHQMFYNFMKFGLSSLKRKDGKRRGRAC